MGEKKTNSSVKKSYFSWYLSLVDKFEKQSVRESEEFGTESLVCKVQSISSLWLSAVQIFLLESAFRELAEKLERTNRISNSSFRILALPCTNRFYTGLGVKTAVETIISGKFFRRSRLGRNKVKLWLHLSYSHDLETNQRYNNLLRGERMYQYNQQQTASHLFLVLLGNLARTRTAFVVRLANVSQASLRDALPSDLQH